MNLYLIAGPPGIGKSTNATEFVPLGLPIIDQDLAAYQYKKKGFSDYADIASVTSNQRIKNYLLQNEDFALELNLGFPSHYAYVQSFIRLNPNLRIRLILFFTDDVNLCLDRAATRFLSGGHEVKPETVREMYDNTMHLFKANKTLFHEVKLINVGYDRIKAISKYSETYPSWVLENGLEAMINEQQ